MNHIVLFYLVGITVFFLSCNTNPENQPGSVSELTDSLPYVLPENHSDLIEAKLRMEAMLRFTEHQLPGNLKEWESYKSQLRNMIIKKTGAVIDHNLPVDLRETGTTQMRGYTVKNIAFQTRPGIYATATLFVPEGDGPFPGVIISSGHSVNGRLGSQTLGLSLAFNGYVCLAIDPWGAGERATIHGEFEYHGANLGAALMNIGETLMGLHITDNMRGVDLLCSLSYVNPEKIGATGASGGGNQTMWLAAMDERVKAAVPVVSVGTFEAYIMRSNCICETLIDGLTFTEEAAVLALVAPRALKISNGLKDAIQAFNPAEMIRSYNNAKPIFELYGAGSNLTHLVFDGPHSYPPETREAMIGLFDLHLKGKGTGDPVKEGEYGERIGQEKLMNFPAGQRDPGVISTAEFCRKRGKELRDIFLNTSKFNAVQKKKELQNIIHADGKSELKEVHEFSGKGGWDRIALETSDNKLIPLLHCPPVQKSAGYTILCSPEGAQSIPLTLINELKGQGTGIVIVDLSGTGEASSTSADRTSIFYIRSRAELWLGRTILGEWVKELNLVSGFLVSRYKAARVNIDGSREAGIAGLLLGALEGNVDKIVLRNAPVSYIFDDKEGIDFFTMAVHLPGFLVWGDVSLAAALSGKNLTFINPVTMSGQKIKEDILVNYQDEYDRIRSICGQPGKTIFIN
jgi:dienelactone hydrolase